MDGQSIKIKIGSKEFKLTAKTPEYERLMRLSSEAINKLVDDYSVKFPAQSEQDRISFAALYIAMQMLSGKKQMAEMEEEERELLELTDSYLKNIENNGR